MVLTITTFKGVCDCFNIFRMGTHHLIPRFNGLLSLTLLFLPEKGFNISIGMYKLGQNVVNLQFYRRP